jgi:hypothetical protein
VFGILFSAMFPTFTFGMGLLLTVISSDMKFPVCYYMLLLVPYEKM